MISRIPPQLQQPAFRFYLVGKQSKRPAEGRWNSVNNYMYLNHKLHDHIAHGGNYGVACGFGNLIVLDFDSKEYYDEVMARNVLPPTFTVLSATKRLPHVYYICIDEPFKKIGVDKDGKRVCDIQSTGTGVVAPNSRVGENSYDIIDNREIEHVTLRQLKRAFNLKEDAVVKPRRREDYNGPVKQLSSVELNNYVKKLLEAGIERKRTFHFSCPLHPTEGGGNLYLNQDGSMYCFHCQTLFKSVDDLLARKK